MTNRRPFLLGLGASILALLGCAGRARDRRSVRGGKGAEAVQTQEIKRAAERFYATLDEAMRTGDVALLDEVLAPGVIDHDPGPGQSPGREGIEKAFGELRAAFPDVRSTAEDMLAEGDRVACRVTVRMTHRGDFLGVAATGKEVVMTGIDILRFAGGKLTDRWGRFDDLGLLLQLGAVIAPPR
jgi:predicted ester cyclase